MALATQDSTTPPSILDRIKLPRLTFSWPQLELVGATPSAEFLVSRPPSTGQLFSTWLATDPALPAFDQIFKPPTSPRPDSPQEWVRTLLARSDQNRLEDEVILKAYHYAHPTPATLFLAPAPASTASPSSSSAAASTKGHDVLHVLLLGPGRLESQLGQVEGSSEAVEPMLATPAMVAALPMSSEEVGSLLWNFTAGTLNPNKGQKVLNESELRMVLDEMPEIAFMLNNDGTASWFNKQWYKYTGLDVVSTFNFDTWLTTFDATDLAGVFRIWHNALETATPFKFQYRVRGRDGLMRWMVCKGRPCWNAQGKVEHWVSTIVDVDDLVRAQAEAASTKNQVQAILASSQTIVLSVSPDLKITFLEGSPHEAHAATVASGASLVGRPLLEACPDVQLAKGIEQVLAGGLDKLTLRTVVVRDGVEVWYRYRLTLQRERAEDRSIREGLQGLVPVTGSPPEAGEQSVIVGVSAIGANITEMVEAERELEKATAEKAKLIASETAAKEASRLKTEYFTHISHEIRTPLAGIMSIAELLLGDDKLEGEHRTLVGQALKSGEALLDLVGMVLDLRKVEVGQLKLEKAPFTLADIVEDAGLSAVIAKQKNLEFIADIGPGFMGPFLGDRMRMRQVLANGLSNAAKFTDKGSVTLRVRQLAELPHRVELEFTIIDMGCGIAPEVLPTLFQPFRQADSSTARRYGGTGLGLVITKELVTLMGGTVDLTSVVGKGTTMRIAVGFDKDEVEGEYWEGGEIRTGKAGTLASGEGRPRRKTLEGRKAGAAGQSEDRLESLKERRKPETVKVLLAEDNELLKSLITRTLEKMNFAVTAVDDGQQAVDAIRRSTYDVVLMDGQMPVKDGYTATREIRAGPDPRIARVRIIALTASAFQGDRERCIEAGMSSYISKPVRARDLELAIWGQLVEEEEEAERRKQTVEEAGAEA